MRKLTAGALTLLLLTACSGDENPEPSASVTPSTSAATTSEAAIPVEPEETAIVVDDEAPVGTTPAEPGPLEPTPDPALVAQMECDDITRATRRSHEARWGAIDWTEAVQIPVGEGLTAGIDWWVVVATPDGATGRARLTNAGSVEDLDDADWLMAEDWQARAEGSSELRVWKYFPTVKWDEDGQRRLHAAVAKGYECLGIAYPESAPSQ
jgi:hypothetical protein